eukprot:m.104703 g.104703  ORF g.104703 m.104703 type:complete len:568 (-) comp15257_c0_seq1:88-1791(-)
MPPKVKHSKAQFAKKGSIAGQPPAKWAALLPPDADESPDMEIAEDDVVDDPLNLVALFAQGGEVWLPLLRDTIQSQPNVDTFLGTKRSSAIVPVREMTFQALKANPPSKWNVVIFGQNPYPRIESATGVAMLDNTFKSWTDKRFGSVTSMRCIMKAATMWKHDVPKATKVSELRTLFAEHKVAPPHEWFQAALAQGCLLLNAGLTASTDAELSTSKHTTFWRPVVSKIVESIMAAKSEAGEGVVFAWWGSHAKVLRKIVDKLSKQYPKCKVVQVDHCNPAAMGDAFCNGSHFADVNAALTKLNLPEIDWLPTEGWQQTLGLEAHAMEKMKTFVTSTVDLHTMYLERLQDVQHEVQEVAAVSGLMSLPVPTWDEVSATLRKAIPSFAKYSYCLDACATFGQQNASSKLSSDEVAAIRLYTHESPLYRRLNAALRDANRAKLRPFFLYLRLFLEALGKVQPYTSPLWRGVRLDLTKLYQKGSTVTWWGVSSCSQSQQVAENFMGSSGTRMLFEVHASSAVGIKPFSAFQGEEEYVLSPGTSLKVTSVSKDKSGKVQVKLMEIGGDRLIS